MDVICVFIICLPLNFFSVLMPADCWLSELSFCKLKTRACHFKLQNEKEADDDEQNKPEHSLEANCHICFSNQLEINGIELALNWLKFLKKKNSELHRKFSSLCPSFHRLSSLFFLRRSHFQINYKCHYFLSALEMSEFYLYLFFYAAFESKQS